MMVVLLIVAFTGPTASSLTPDSRSFNDEFELLRDTIKPSNQSLAEPSSGSYSAYSFFSVVGFVSKLVGFYSFIDSLIAPEKKIDLDGVLNTMNVEFNQVKDILDKMDKKLDQLLLNSFQNVEISVIAALKDFRHGTPSDHLGQRHFTLDTQLTIFLNGMLGKGIILPDLLLNVRDFYEVI